MEAVRLVKRFERQPVLTTTLAVLPAYNEERTIGSAVALIKNYVDEVIVIDDGSTDRTAAIAEASGASVVTQPNQGYGGAIQTGFQIALSTSASFIVLLDADLQHDPSDIPMMLEPLIDGRADVATGNRFIASGVETPRFRRFGQGLITTLNNTTGGARTSDSQNGFRAFTREALSVLNVHSKGMGFASEMFYAIKDADLRMVEVATKVNYAEPPKRSVLAHGIEVFDAIMSVVARRRPLLFISMPGAIASCIGLILGIFVAYNMAQTGELMVGSAIVTALLLMTGLLLGVTGVLLHSMGHFISRLRDEVLSQRQGENSK